jgi:hypothetical protein
MTPAPLHGVHSNSYPVSELQSFVYFFYQEARFPSRIRTRNELFNRKREH